MSKISKAIYQARKDGSEISANIKLVRDGRFSSVSGKVKDLKVSRDGFAYATIQIDGNKPYQNVRLENILCVNKDNKLYKK